MSAPPWDQQAKDRAKKHGRYLVKIYIQGRYAKEGPFAGGSLGLSGDVDIEVIEKLMEVSNLISFGDKDVPEGTVDRDVLYDLMSLVIDKGKLPMRSYLSMWSQKTLKQVEAWAAAEHLAASDNPVKRLPLPEVLKPFLEVA